MVNAIIGKEKELMYISDVKKLFLPRPSARCFLWRDKVGTINKGEKNKEIMAKLSNEQKIEVIKNFLKENNIEWVDNYQHEQAKVLIPCFIPAHRIGIRIGDDQEWFLSSKRNFYPIFIREEDTKAKVLEKIQNTIINSMTLHQQAILRKEQKNKG